MDRSHRTACWRVGWLRTACFSFSLYHRDWDHHSTLKSNLANKAQGTDRATAAQREMLNDTLVAWAANSGACRFHRATTTTIHINGVSFTLAGGGSRRLTYGSTDDLGHAAKENAIAVPDLHATMLQLLGSATSGWPLSSRDLTCG